MTRTPLLRGLSLGVQIGLSVSLPLVLLGLGGRWLDRHFETFPFLFLGGMIVAVLLGLVLATRLVWRVLE